MRQGDTLWDKRFVLINLTLFLIFSNISFFYLYPLALTQMGCQHFLIGLVVGIFSAVTVLSRPFMGKLAARHGEPRLIIFGITAILVASFSYIFEHAVDISVMITRTVHGIGFSAFIAGSFSLIAKAFPATKRAQAYGVVGAALMGAAALCPPLGEILISKKGFEGLYAVACIAAACALILMAMFSKHISLPVSKGVRTPVHYTKIIRDHSLAWVLLSTLIFAHCQSTVLNFVALLARSKGVLSGPFFLITFSVAIFFLMGFARKIDRFGKRRFLRLCYPLLIAGLFTLPGSMGTELSFAPALLFGSAMGFLFPAHNALAADHGGMTEKPGVMSLFTAVYDTGFVTGAVVSGWISQQIGLAHLFLMTGSVAIAGFGIALFSPIKRD